MKTELFYLFYVFIMQSFIILSTLDVLIMFVKELCQGEITFLLPLISQMQVKATSLLFFFMAIKRKD